LVFDPQDDHRNNAVKPAMRNVTLSGIEKVLSAVAKVGTHYLFTTGLPFVKKF
jgi:hypothetical protein